MYPRIGSHVGKPVVWTGIDSFCSIPLAVAQQGRAAVDRYIEQRIESAVPNKGNDYCVPTTGVISPAIRDAIVTIAVSSS